MNQSRFDGRSEVEEVTGRLRLSRLAPGIDRPSVSVSQWTATTGAPVVIHVSPPDPELVAKIEALFPDIAVRIAQGVWERPSRTL